MTEPRLNHDAPIPIPWRVRWVRFRHQLLPVLTLIFCSILAAWLWYNQTAAGQATGAVEMVRLPVTTGVQGTLAPLPGKQIEMFDKVAEGDVVAALEPGPMQARRKVVQAELEELLRQEKESPERAAALRTLIDGKEQDLADVDTKLQSLQLRSPLSGTVIQIFRRPGQAVQPGEPILEVASDRGTAVVTYLRQEQQHITPTKGMHVDVRLNRMPAKVVEGTVASVGGQIESVPNRQLRDQRVPEWGLPVRVTVPPDSGVDLRPGEGVTLHFRPAPAATPGR